MSRDLMIASVLVLVLASFAVGSVVQAGQKLFFKGFTGVRSELSHTVSFRGVGEKGGPCKKDGTCTEGLVCSADAKVCVAPSPGIVRPADLDREIYITKEMLLCPAGMAFIKGGTFEMGSESSGFNKPFENEEPVHSVTVSGFCMDKHEFTNGNKDTADFAGYSWPPPSPYAGLFRRDNQPLNWVNWQEAKAICEKQGKRLPTEAEWEYAARGGKNFDYGTDDGTVHENGDNACWTFDEMRYETCAVKSYAANPFGLYDMAGNVWEWVADWYDEKYYASSAARGPDPTGPETGTRKVARGGYFGCVGPKCLRAAIRGAPDDPRIRDVHVGFRCVAAPRNLGE